MRGVWRTCMAPLFAVTFGDNLIGDVMTSLAKPLQESPPVLRPKRWHQSQENSVSENPEIRRRHCFHNVGPPRSGDLPRDRFFTLSRFLTLPGPSEGPRRL